MPQDAGHELRRALDPLVEDIQQGFRAKLALLSMLHGFNSQTNMFVAGLKKLEPGDWTQFWPEAELMIASMRDAIARLQIVANLTPFDEPAKADIAVAPALTVVPTGDDPTFRVARDGDWPTMG